MALDRTRISPTSSTWQEIQGWAEAEISKATKLAITPGLAEVPTEIARARIAVLAELLRLPTPDKVAAQLAGSSGGYPIEAGST